MINIYRMLVIAGIVLLQVSGANAQFGGGGLGNLINKKLNKQNKPNNQPPAAETVTTNNTSGVDSANETGIISNPKRKASSNDRAYSSLPPIFEAARQGDEVQFAELLKNSLSSINKKIRAYNDKYVGNEFKQYDPKLWDYTLLDFAAEKGSTNIIQQLLDHGAKVDSAYGQSLQLAASNGHLEAVKMLLKAEAGTIDQAIAYADKAQQTELVARLNEIKKAQDEITKAEEVAQAEKERAKQAELVGRLNQVVELKKAMYGIPLGANLDEVRKWLEEKNVPITCDTKPVIDEYCRRVLNTGKGYLPGVEVGENDIQYAQLEQQLAKISSSSVMADPNTSTFVRALKTCCDTLKHPTISYKGTTYFLSSLRQEALSHEDEILTKGIYKFSFGPSSEMQEDTVKRIDILFRKKGDALLSYAVVGRFVDIRKISGVLDEKYGGKEKAEHRGKELFRITGLSTFARLKGMTEIGEDKFDYDKVCVEQWRKNILMADDAEDTGYKGFVILYYDAEAANELISKQDVALKEYREGRDREQRSKEQKSQERLKDNF